MLLIDFKFIIQIILIQIVI